MNELRECVARALFEAEFGDEFAWPSLPEWLSVGAYRRKADAVLAVLGLDDLDEAVERLATFMSATEPYRHFHPENLKGHARRALEAALTAESS